MDIDEVIYKKLNGQATKEELVFLIEWVKQSDKNQLVFTEIETHWQGKDKKLAQLKKDTWEQLNSSISKEEEGKQLHREREPGKNFFLTFRKVAATVLILLSIGLGWYYLDALVSSHTPTSTDPIEFITRYNPMGVKSTIVLPDKSKVKLNSNSKITFPKVFTGDFREVSLEGEAFFEVTKIPEKPFLVKTGSLTTEVKGTSFNINAYDMENDIQVAVESGLVSVYCKKDGTFLHPGEMAEYTSEEGEGGNGSTLKKRKFAPEEIAWKDGLIVFSSSSFQEVMEKLHYWFGVEVIQKKKIEFREGFTGKYQNRSLDEIMKSISYSANFKYKIDRQKNTLIIW